MTQQITISASSPLHTEYGEFTVYVVPEGAHEHVVVVKGEVRGQAQVPVRIHSSCVLSESLGSLECDCDAQLARAFETLQNADCGMLIYLRQDGRGLGLASQVATHALVHQGITHEDAHARLGLAFDRRIYDVAVSILNHFEVRSVILATNNREKIRALEDAGIKVAREPMVVEVHHELAYRELMDKSQRPQYSINL